MAADDGFSGWMPDHAIEAVGQYLKAKASDVLVSWCLAKPLQLYDVSSVAER